MGCQKDIAADIRERGADYVLAVKGNQPRLFEDVQEAVAAYLDHSVAGDDGQILETVDDGHGRREVRTYTLVTDLDGIRDRGSWPDLYAVCMAVSERTLAGKTTAEVRYYIGSMKGTVADHAQVIRGHWGIENSQSDDPPSAGLCATSGSGYHRPRCPSDAGRMVRPAPRSRRRPMPFDRPALTPPRP
jgi:predicted transposase YbfD/YdcC